MNLESPPPAQGKQRVSRASEVPPGQQVFVFTGSVHTADVVRDDGHEDDTDSSDSGLDP